MGEWGLRCGGGRHGGEGEVGVEDVNCCVLDQLLPPPVTLRTLEME